MRFSLIMATLNRTDEVDSFINSLLVQTYKNFELVIVDQNRDNRIQDIYAKYRDIINIKYIRSERQGLSLNRNIGLDICGGDIIAFPDDDCEYSNDTLEKAACFFKKELSFDFYTCNVKEKTGGKSVLVGNQFDTEITIENFMAASISITLFIRAASIASFRFDEQLGAGAKYGSAEESDLVLFLLKNNNRGFYHADTYIYHPNSPRSISTLLSYGKGFGALHKKAITVYHLYRFLPRFLLVLLKETIKLCFFSPGTERMATMKGRIFGFIHYEKNSD
jgi:glycosyltransferase involved in cell wall biosynthesis